MVSETANITLDQQLLKETQETQLHCVTHPEWQKVHQPSMEN